MSQTPPRTRTRQGAPAAQRRFDPAAAAPAGPPAPPLPDGAEEAHVLASVPARPPEAPAGLAAPPAPAPEPPPAPPLPPAPAGTGFLPPPPGMSAAPPRPQPAAAPADPEEDAPAANIADREIAAGAVLPPPPGLSAFPAGPAMPAPGAEAQPWQPDAAPWQPAEAAPESASAAGPGPEPGAPEPEPEPRRLAAAAYRGSLTEHPVHSICSLELRPGYDEITPALAVFDRLEDGEHAFIKFALRRAPGGTSASMQEAFLALQSHVPLEKPSGWRHHLSAWSGYAGQMLWHMFSPASKGVEQPRTPLAKADPSKPPPRHEIPENHNHAVNFAKEKVMAPGFYEAELHIGAIGPEGRQDELQAICAELQKEFNASYSNSATGQGFAYEPCDPEKAVLGLMSLEAGAGSILSPPELGEMMKVPDKLTSTPGLAVEFGMRAVPPRKPIIIPDPLNPPPGFLAFGEIFVGTNKQRAIGMPIKGLNTHMYLCGTTGAGKSTLLEWFTYGLAKNGKSIFLIDPHGTLVDNILPYILAFAPERAKDILILDFGDTSNPVAFNPIAIDNAAEIEGTVNSVKEMILKMLNLSPDSAPRAVNYTEQAVWALCEANLSAFSGHKHLALTLLQVPTFLTDEEFRHMVMSCCTNLAIKENFGPGGIYDQLGARQQLEHCMPVLRTFASLSTKDSFGNVFGQPESKLDFAKFVRENKLVFMKLPAIAGGDATVAKFIGTMITPMLIGSLSKWGHDPNLSAYLMIDEFQNYATESYKELLAQTRKHGLHAISANQVPQDLPADVLRGVQSNTQTKISMRLDPQAVKAVADFIASGQPYPRTDDILALPNYWGWCNHMMDDGTSSGPFVFKGLAPPLTSLYPWHADSDAAVAEAKARIDDLMPKVVKASRLASTQPRHDVEAARQSHVKNSRAVLERKVQDDLRAGRFAGAPGSAEEELLADEKYLRGR